MFSYWQKENFLTQADIAIAGGGLMGLWTAIEYKKQHPKHEVLVIERAAFPDGASVRNAGFSCFGSAGELLSDIEQFGANETLKVAALRYKGLCKIQQSFPHSIGYEPVGGYEVFADADRYQAAAGQLARLNELMADVTGVRDTFLPCDDLLAPMGLTRFCGMIRNRYEGTINSGKLLQGLVSAASEYGIRFLWGSPFDGYEIEDGFVRINCGDVVLKSGKLLLAMNAYNAKFLPEQEVTPARGQILMTDEIENLKLRGSFHYDAGFYYFRNVGNRVLIGGARNWQMDEERSFDVAVNDAIQRHLESFLAKHIVGNKRFAVTERWAGIMSFTKTKMPEIYSVSPSVVAANACNGMGVALTSVFSEEVAAHLGKD